MRYEQEVQSLANLETKDRWFEMSESNFPEDVNPKRKEPMLKPPISRAISSHGPIYEQ